MKSARPVVVPDLFVRTYIGDRDRYWVAVRRRHGRRVVLDLVDRLIVERCDGQRTLEQLRGEVSEAAGKPLGGAELHERYTRLLTEGVVVPTEDEYLDEEERSPPNLVFQDLTPEEVAGLRPAVLPGTRTGCDGRGDCCRLYERIDVTEEDIQRIYDAYGTDELTPGGLTLASAIRVGLDGRHSLAANGGACVLLEEGGRCGVHARLGVGGKPTGCRTYPLRDVLCDDTLFVAVIPECRCAVDFAADGQPIDDEAAALLARRRHTREFEAVAETVGATLAARWPKARYLAWRDEARRRIPGRDPLTWALEEATRLQGGAAAPSIAEVAALLGPILLLTARREAGETVRVYASTDLQPRIFDWAAASIERLLGLAADQILALAPVDGELLLVEQLLFGHGILRARTLVSSLGGLALRLALARAAVAIPAPPSVHPLTTWEYLFRAQGFSYLCEQRAKALEELLRGAGRG